MTNLPEQMHAPQSTAVATRPAGDTHTLDASDVRLPRMKLAQLSNKQVIAGVASYGDVIIAFGEDDMEPTILAKGKPNQGELGDEVIFYVLDVTKGHSYIDKNGRFERSRDGSYPDLADVKGQEPANVKRTYDYTIVVPAYEDLPVRFLMTGSWGGPASKTLNTRLALANTQKIAWHTIPFRLQTNKAQNDYGAFVKAVVGKADVKAKDLAAHQALVDQFKDLVSAPAADEAPAPVAVNADAPSLD